MKRIFVALVVAILAATVIPYAQSPQEFPLSDAETSSLWFVELSSPPTSEGTSLAALEREESDFHAAAVNARIAYSERKHFRDLWNGLTVTADNRSADKLRGVAGVQSVYPVMKVTLAQEATDPGSVVDLITAIKMTGADIAQSELGLTGRGVRVAIMDTGIDYNHPDLGGCFGPGCRVEKGFDLVGDAFNAEDAVPVIAPDPDPDDCAGHGTHVAGIVGANGGIKGLKGVAPDVKFHAYRVFGCEGSTTSDIMLEAMEMVLRDRADVLNMSIGSALAWPQYPTAQASNRLVKRGVVVVASIGNDSNLGLYGASAPGVGRDVIGVASFDNTNANLVAFTVSPDNVKMGYIGATGSPAAPTTGSFPLARTGTATSTADGCAVLPAGSLAGKVALIRRGTCGFYQKAFNAQSAGAVGVILYNNVLGFLNATVAGTPAITVPVVTITASNGVIIDGRLAGGPVTMTWTDQLASEPNPTANLISSFSSWGLPPDLSFKPDIGAPGGSIRSTLPLEQGGYGTLSGTSMSSPHVAGAVALLLQARPRTRPDEVQARLQNLARPHPVLNLASGFIDAVHRQGAGMLQIDEAVLSDVVVTPSSLALGEIESGSVTKVLKIRQDDSDDDRGDHWCRRHGRRDHDDDDDAVTYTLGHQPAVATGANTFTPTLIVVSAAVGFSQPTVTVGGHRGRHDDVAFVGVTITPPGPTSLSRLFGGYITLTPDDGGPMLRVPYAGYNGDYQAIPVMTLAGFPLLARLTATGFLPQPGGASFTLQGNDLPFILLHLNHQVQVLKMEVFDVATGASLNFADNEKFVIRNSTPTSFFAVPWDGTTFKRTGGKITDVPNGTYRIDLSILKALGDPANPAHVETWSSPNITIARP